MTSTPNPQLLDINIQQGVTWRRQPLITWETGDPYVPVNLTGYTARMQVKERPTSAALFTLTDVDGITLHTDGRIDVDISEARAKLLVQRNLPHVYSLRLKAPNAVDSMIVVYGDVIVNPEVTESA